MFENKESYPYSFEPSDPEGQQHLQNNPTPPTSPEGPEHKRPHRRGRGARIVALAVACAIVGGAGGSAVTYYVSSQNQQQAEITQAETTESTTDDNVILNQVVHQNTGDKSLTPQEVYNMYVNSVVGITTSGTTTNVFGQQTEFAASGSGFIITDDGYIVTNHHVIEDASSITVSLYDGTTYDATLVGSDSSNDVAVLKVDATGLQPVSIGDSDEVEVGDQVAAIGNPLGQLTFSLTVGYVSALDRAIDTDGTPINMLQTDAAINSGNSGGPLFDMNGNVIGITTAKYSGSTSSGTSIEGIGFAIPIDDAMSTVNDLINYGYVTGQAYLGIAVRELDTTTAKYYGLPAGVYVDSVTEGSCSDKAGLQQGDIITALDDTAVESYTDLAAALKEHKAGEEITLSVYRSGQDVTLKVTLDEKLPEEESADAQAEATPEANQEPQDNNGYYDFFFGR